MADGSTLLPTLSNNPSGRLPSDLQPLKRDPIVVVFVKGSSSPEGTDSNEEQPLKIIPLAVTSV